MSGKAEKGHSGAHTPARQAAIDADLGAPGAVDALAGRDLDELLEGSPDVEATDLLALAAEPALVQRRARGRPAGAANRKSGDLVKYLAALGHRDPAVTLSLIQSADTQKLALALGATTAKLKIAVLGLQKAAAEALMPYHHAKQPQQLTMPGGVGGRPLMVIGELNGNVIAGAGFMTAGVMPEGQGEQNQGVIEGEPVRPSCDPDEGEPSG